MNINWDWIGKAVQHYTDNEFIYKEAPWNVSEEAIITTIPNGRYPLKINHKFLNLGYLVGSAEQSFIEMMLHDELSAGKYCAAGPCFRDEDIDEWHSYTFFKVELIEVNPNSKNIFEIMDCAKDFMETLGNCKIIVEKTDEGFDLIYKGIELGSYGYRTSKNFNWIYGTGLALPRFSKVLEL